MGITYYEYSANVHPTGEPSGLFYTYIGGDLYELTVDTVKSVQYTDPAQYKAVCNVTPITEGLTDFLIGFGLWLQPPLTLNIGNTSLLTIIEVKDGSGEGVAGIDFGVDVTESSYEPGKYYRYGTGLTFTPTKTDYTFDPVSFSPSPGGSHGAYLTFTAIGPVIPTLEYPDEDGTNYYLNKDWLLEMRWADTEGVPIADHTLYFAASGDPEFIPRTDRTRYSIVAYKMWLDVTLDYSTTYYWYIRKDLGGGDYVDSEIWAFTTAAYAPPTYSTRTRPPYGGGADITVPTGENNMITVERLIAIAQNKFFYEDV